MCKQEVSEWCSHVKPKIKVSYIKTQEQKSKRAKEEKNTGDQLRIKEEIKNECMIVMRNQKQKKITRIGRVCNRDRKRWKAWWKVCNRENSWLCIESSSERKWKWNGIHKEAFRESLLSPLLLLLFWLLLLLVYVRFCVLVWCIFSSTFCQMQMNSNVAKNKSNKHFQMRTKINREKLCKVFVRICVRVCNWTRLESTWWWIMR